MNGKIEFVRAGVLNEQEIIGHLVYGDAFQSSIDANAMIDMDHGISRNQLT